METRSGTVEDLVDGLPRFARRPFAVVGSGGRPTGENLAYDVVVRLATPEDEAEIPVGVVSKTYHLVQHHEVLRLAVEAIEGQGIDPRPLRAEVMLTERGERMALVLTLPASFEYQCPTSPDDRMSLRFHCFNSVDGSTKLIALLGWHRLVCANGMIVGQTLAQYRRAHDRRLSPDRLGVVLQHGLAQATAERNRNDQWAQTRIEDGRLQPWVDGDLRKAWGPKAAARALAVGRTGRDAELKDPFAGGPPSERAVVLKAPVPGAIVPAETAFAVSQVLSWLANRRRELPERIRWTAEIPRLIEALLRTN